MAEKNTCVNCGIELSELDKRFCKHCAKKFQKKHLSNWDIQAKYALSRDKIKIISNNLIKKIDEELEKLFSLKEKFILNDSNSKLLDIKMSKLVLLRDKLIESRQQTLKEEL